MAGRDGGRRESAGVVAATPTVGSAVGHCVALDPGLGIRPSERVCAPFGLCVGDGYASSERVVGRRAGQCRYRRCISLSSSRDLVLERVLPSPVLLGFVREPDSGGCIPRDPLPFGAEGNLRRGVAALRAVEAE